MTLTTAGLRIAVAAILVGIVLAGCGGRFEPRGADAADTGSGVAAPSAAEPTIGPEPTVTPGQTSPPGSTAPATSAAPAPKPSPVPTPDLGALDQLIDQLDAALAADATATTDEGSPQ